MDCGAVYCIPTDVMYVYLRYPYLEQSPILFPGRYIANPPSRITIIAL